MPVEVSLPTADGTLTLRPMRDTEDDAAFHYALFVATRAADMAAMPIDAAGKDFLLRMQYASQTATYRRDYPAARFEVIELAGEPIGRIVTDVGDAWVTYVDLALLPHVQRRGLATELMLHLLDEPRRLGLAARVSVLEQNAASLSLFRRLGFVAVASAPPFVRLEWQTPACGPDGAPSTAYRRG
ncbi:MAG TPA: GNAT family N-acetyltransferase [Acetobacteraceae bacterium]|nr:GNAT family N-acetyltransferase [Acetobacteraceae bacterium]